LVLALPTPWPLELMRWRGREEETCHPEGSALPRCDISGTGDYAYRQIPLLLASMASADSTKSIAKGVAVA